MSKGLSATPRCLFHAQARATRHGKRAITSLSTFQRNRPRSAAALSVLLLYVLLCLPTVIWMIGNERGLSKAAGYSLTNFCLYCVPTILFRRHMRWYVRGLALIAAFIPMVLLAARFGMVFDQEVALYALDVGKVGGYAFLEDNLFALLALPLLPALVCLCAELIPASLPLRRAAVISSLCVVPVLLLPLGMDKSSSYPMRIVHAVTYSFPFNVPNTLAVLLQRQHGIQAYQDSRASPADVRRLPGSSRSAKSTSLFWARHKDLTDSPSTDTREKPRLDSARSRTCSLFAT